MISKVLLVLLLLSRSTLSNDYNDDEEDSWSKVSHKSNEVKVSHNKPNYNNNPCSQGCVCEPWQNPTRVNCAKSNIDVIPQDLPPMMTKLDVSGNNLFKLDNGPLAHYTLLVSLIASDNKIGEITSDNFARQSRLEDLELSGNKISRLTNVSFRGLVNLKKLDLARNNLETLYDHGFKSCVKLQHLDLSNNRLTELPSDAFSGIENLQVLLLNNNLFNTIPSNSFYALRHLSELDLGDNTIDDISSNTFDSFPKLTKLSLNKCQLKSLTPYAFAHLYALKWLNLGSNQLSTVPRKALAQLGHLEHLEIGLNYIRQLTNTDMTHLANLRDFSMFGCHRDVPLEITSTAFQDNTELESINITNCIGLTDLPEQVFTSLPYLKVLNFHNSGLSRLDHTSASWSSLSYLNLQSNPIDCNCDILWLQELYALKSSFPDPKCAYPDHLHGKDLLSVDICEEEVGISDGTKTKIIAGICGPILIILLGLALYIYYRKRRSWVTRRRLKKPNRRISKAEITVVPEELLDNVRYRDVENIYEDLADMPLGGAKNYPDVKTTVL